MKLAVATLLTLAGLAPASAAPVVELRCAPVVAMAPADLEIEITVSPNAANRAVKVETDSGDFYRSSAWTVDGENAPKRFRVVWRDLPMGDYDVVAGVFDSVKLRATAVAKVMRR